MAGAAQRQPVHVEGIDYPTKTAAIMALHSRNTLSHSQIAALVGTDTGSVGAVISQQRRKAARANGDASAMPGLWTPEKRDKVRRLFGRTMVLIADSVQVPPAELLTYVLHGVIPPSQAIRDPGDIRWNTPKDGVQVQLPAPPDRLAKVVDDYFDRQEEDVAPAGSEMLPREAFEGSDTDPDVVDADHMVEPGREDDEAELARLAALEAGEVAPPAPERFQEQAPDTGPVEELVVVWQYRLKNEVGEYLHKSGKGMTRNIDAAWKGPSQQLEEILKRHPHLKELDEQRCK